MPWFELDHFVTALSTLFILAVLFSIGLNCYWFVVRKNSAGNSEPPGSANQQQQGSNLIIEFLQRQIAQTKAFLKTQPEPGLPKLNHKTIALRTAYLNIERRGLGYGESSNDYWDYLNRRLLKLLETFMPQLFGRDSQIQELENRVSLLKQRIQALAKHSAASSENAIQTLDEFLAQHKKTVKDQPDISGYLEKMENSVLAFEDPEFRKLNRYSKEANHYAKTSIDILNKLQKELDVQAVNIQSLEKNSELPNTEATSNNQELINEYDNLKRELATKREDNEKLQQRIAQLKKEISDYEQQALQCGQQSAKNLSSEEGKLAGTRDAVKEIHDLSMKIAEQTNQEINQLRSLLGRQNSSINNLDSRVAVLNTSQGGETAEEKDKLIEKLRCNILNSELCINTLEKQVEELTSQLGDICAADASKPSAKDMENLNQELHKFKTELEQAMSGKHVKESVLEYVNEALEASSLEDLAVMMYHHLGELGCDPAIEISYVDKTLCVSASGKLSTQDRLLVENMQINEIDAGEKDNALKFRMLHLRGVLRSSSGAMKAFKDNKKQLIEMVQATDKLIEKVGATQLFKNHKKQLELCQNTIKKVAFEVDQRFDYHAKRAKEVVGSSVGQLQDIAQGAGLAKNKIDAFAKVHHQSLKDLDIDKAMRVKTRESFLALIRTLESA